MSYLILFVVVFLLTIYVLYKVKDINKPNFKTPKYGIKFYYPAYMKICRLGEIDTALDILAVEFNKVHPKVKLDKILKYYKMLEVRFCSDWDNGLYVDCTEAMTLNPKCTKIVGGSNYYLQDGVTRGTYIVLRRVDDDILKTRFLEQVYKGLLDRFKPEYVDREMSSVMAKIRNAMK